MESTTRLIVLEEGLAGGSIQEQKEAWLEQNGQVSTVIAVMVAGLLEKILSSDTTIPKFDNHLPYYLIWLIFLVCLSNGILTVVKHFISGKNDLSLCMKKMYIGLTLLAGIAVTSTNVAFLCIVDKSYSSFAIIPFLQLFLLTRFFYLELKSDQNQELQTETMVKNCFKVAKPTTSACYAVQAALIFGYSKNPNIPAVHLHYTLLVSFLTSVVGYSAMIVTSSPLDFKSSPMYRFLKNIPMVMPFLAGLVAAILSAAFLNPTMIAFAVVFPFVGESMVILSLEYREEPASDEDASRITEVETDSTITDVETDSTFGISIVVLCAIYALTSGTKKYSSYLTYWSVFSFLLVIISTSIRMAFPRRPARRVIESIINSTPMVESLVGLALLSAEIHAYIKGTDSVV